MTFQFSAPFRDGEKRKFLFIEIKTFIVNPDVQFSAPFRDGEKRKFLFIEIEAFIVNPNIPIFGSL